MKNKSVDFDLTKNPITNTTYKKTNPFPKELLQLDEARIKAFIAILQEHEANLEKEFKFNEAANVRERINNLKLLEEEKLRSHSNKTHKEEQTLLDQVKQDEIDRFNEEYDNLYNELSRKCNEMQQQLLDQQKEDMENQVKEFHETFPKENPKLSTEILDLYRKMEYNAKKKDFKKAEEIHTEIKELTEAHHRKWNEVTREEKLLALTRKIQSKHDGEIKNLKLKIDGTINELNIKRSKEFEKLNQKFRNKDKDLKTSHKIQNNILDSPRKDKAAMTKSKAFKMTGFKNTANVVNLTEGEE